MMKTNNILCCLILLTIGTLHAQTKNEWVKKVGARKQPAKKEIFKVPVATDSTVLHTAAIQKTIDDCAAAGGGIVSFEPGVYLTGSVFLKDGVHLKIDRGVKLKGSQDIRNYPETDSRIAGIEMKWPSALINVIGRKNVAISGDGVVHAQGKVFWEMYWKMRKEYEAKGLRWIIDYDAKRPRTVLISGSADVTLKGLTLQQAGFWTVQVLYSDHITVEGLLIQNNIDGHGPSTDGVDIDSSSWVLVENCDIDCNDDNFCIKSGRDWDGLRVNRPAEYVVIRKCLARKGGGLVTLGSETSGSIRHILATDLRGKGTKNALNMKSAVTRGGTVEDIYFENIAMDSIGTFLQVNMNWNPAYSYSKLPKGYNESTIPLHWKKLLKKVEPAKKGIPVFRDVYISNINIQGAKTAINANGLAQSKLRGFHLKNVTVTAEKAGLIDHAIGWEFNNVKIITPDQGKPELKDATDMNIPIN
ncbi:glycoside hydrolase family 28 protein [Pedobacter sp. MC2016-15]|uniref:glycoside hydrolase family 28 protein n=1 Tax=Pedobacter sp. MC2016-15 TaxID=2994473 RepID=UPI0022454CE2|nr:glycoside hydrolase family 28 protein [Pedobacter sp. MC2016-15]MCX2479809.1 glycoside hydrolase family 28 protein [Pedobacter sp. MC2016-15]